MSSGLQIYCFGRCCRSTCNAVLAAVIWFFESAANLVAFDLCSQALNLSQKSLRHCGDVFDGIDLTNLQELDLRHNFLTSIHPLKSLEVLQKLLLQSNNIGNGPLLEEHSSIGREFTESGTQPESGPLLSQKQGPLPRTPMLLYTRSPEQSLCLQKLEILDLDRNSISDIKSMNLQQSSPNLKLLSLRRNIISKVDGLSGLLSLEKLYLDHNCIKKIDPGSFENLPCLEEIHLSDNTIKTAKFMEGLSSLRSLNLVGNYLMVDRLGGFPCIKELSSLSSLQQLTLSENPICRQPHYRCAVISILRQLVCLDGEDVTEAQVAEAKGYVNREERAEWAVEQEAVAAIDAQGVTGVKVIALKMKPFNFEAMSDCQLHSQSWDFEHTRISRGSKQQDGEPRPPPPTLLWMRQFCRFKEKHVK